MVRVDPVDLERRGLDVRVLERQHVVADRLGAPQRAVVLDPQRHRGDLEQRVGLRIEAAGLDVDHDGQEPAEAFGDRLHHERRARWSNAAAWSSSRFSV